MEIEDHHSGAAKLMFEPPRWESDGKFIKCHFVSGVKKGSIDIKLHYLKDKLNSKDSLQAEPAHIESRNGIGACDGGMIIRWERYGTDLLRLHLFDDSCAHIMHVNYPEFRDLADKLYAMNIE